ncbi:MAG: sigma 54-interacting transcriptional regulator [Telluria sp.]
MKFSPIAEIESIDWNQEEFLSFLRDPRWTTMCDFLTDGMVLVDRAGIVQYLNAAAEGLNEFTREQCIGRPITEMISQSVIPCAGLLEAFERQRRFTESVLDASGRRIAVSGRPIRDSKSVMNCFLISQRNLDFLLRQPQGVGPYGAGQRTEPETGTTLIGASERSARMLSIGIKAMAMGSRILLLGESGVGKTEFARQLHRRARRAAGPFVHVNCASIPESLFESEMFGFERGSFTGANTRGKAGLIESADGGTLFLDEIGETPLQLQAKLLQVLESGMVQRLGATSPRKVHIQVVAATNRDLREFVAAGRFRQDLFYRLSVVSLALPALREQPELLDPLIDHFLRMANARRPAPLDIEDGCRAVIKRYAFPGNIREMQNLIEYLSVVCDEHATTVDLPMEFSGCGAPAPLPRAGADSEVYPLGEGGLKELIRKYEGRIIADAIKKTGSKRKAAEYLHTDIATIVRKSRATPI